MVSQNELEIISKVFELGNSSKWDELLDLYLELNLKDPIILYPDMFEELRQSYQLHYILDFGDNIIAQSFNKYYPYMMNWYE